MQQLKPRAIWYEMKGEMYLDHESGITKEAGDLR